MESPLRAAADMDSVFASMHDGSVCLSSQCNQEVVKRVAIEVMTSIEKQELLPQEREIMRLVS